MESAKKCFYFLDYAQGTYLSLLTRVHDDFQCVLNKQCDTTQMSVVLRRQNGKNFLFQSFSACSFPLTELD